jgi:glycosyltransferase involved in cell wall biosynthesis
MDVATTSSRKIAISANCAWNLVNFRKPIIRALIRSGWSVVALVPSDEFTPELERLGIEVQPLAMDARGVSPLSDSVLLLRYYQLLRRIKPTLFLGFTAKPNIYGSAAAAWAGVASVATSSGLGTAFLSGRVLQALVMRLYRWGLRHSHCVFFHNEDDLQLFVGNGIVDRRQAAVIKGSGVNLREFAPVKDLGSRTAPLTFLFIGRFLKDKGLREFIAAAAEVKQEQPARFQVIGSVEDHPKAVPADIVTDAVENGHIELLGTTADVRPFVASADCVVLPSYREGLPRVVLEAAAMGKPVIAADVPGCRDAVDSGITGFLCEARSASSLAETIRDFAAMPCEERVSMGLRARAKAEREFSEDRVVAAYLEAIADLVTKRQPHGCGEALA